MSLFGDRKRLERAAQEMDREYGAAQLYLLAHMSQFAASGGQPSGEDADTLKRVLMRIVAWGVSHDDLAQRGSDHTFWMFACDKHPEEVLRWDQELTTLQTESARREATDGFRNQYQSEFAKWLEAEKAKEAQR